MLRLGKSLGRRASYACAALLVLIGSATSPTIATEINRQSALIVAESLAARYVSAEDDIAPSKAPGEVSFGAIYDVDIRVKRVLAGQVKEENFTFRLSASNKGHFALGNTLVIALDKDAGMWVVRSWEAPMEIICIPPEVVEEFELQNTFDGSITYSKEQCASL